MPSDSNPPHPNDPPPDDAPGEGEVGVRVIPSSEIFHDGSRRVIIRHGGRDYLLLVTKQGKLLLNRIG